MKFSIIFIFPHSHPHGWRRIFMNNSVHWKHGSRAEIVEEISAMLDFLLWIVQLPNLFYPIGIIFAPIDFTRQSNIAGKTLQVALKAASSIQTTLKSFSLYCYLSRFMRQCQPDTVCRSRLSNSVNFPKLNQLFRSSYVYHLFLVSMGFLKFSLILIRMF